MDNKIDTPVIEIPVRQIDLPVVEILIPFFNEEAILRNSLQETVGYLQAHSDLFKWKLLLIDDGSRDNSREIANNFAKKNPDIRVIYHEKNKGLGEALQLGFAESSGDYLIVLDADLSYSLGHIEKLYRKIRETHADVVVASPYMNGGRTENVPFFRKHLSKFANRFLSRASKAKVSTMTGMVRIYNGEFIRSLSLRSKGSELMPEILYKAVILDARIEEIPAKLAWLEGETKNRSKMHVFRHTLATLLTGFLIRPVLFFILPGLVILLFSIYTNTWMLIHLFNEYSVLDNLPWFTRLNTAFKNAYNLHTHTYIFGLLSLMLAIQLIALGFQSLQAKYYFEEIFVLGTKLFRNRKKNEDA